MFLDHQKVSETFLFVKIETNEENLGNISVVVICNFFSFFPLNPTEFPKH